MCHRNRVFIEVNRIYCHRYINDQPYFCARTSDYSHFKSKQHRYPKNFISLVYLLTSTSFCSPRDTVLTQTNTLSFTDTVKLFPLRKLQFGTDVSSQSKFEQCSQGRLKNKMQDFQILNIYHGFTHTSKYISSTSPQENPTTVIGLIFFVP